MNLQNGRSAAINPELVAMNFAELSAMMKDHNIEVPEHIFKLGLVQLLHAWDNTGEGKGHR